MFGNINSYDLKKDPLFIGLSLVDHHHVSHPIAVLWVGDSLSCTDDFLGRPVFSYMELHELLRFFSMASKGPETLS